MPLFDIENANYQPGIADAQEQRIHWQLMRSLCEQQRATVLMLPSICTKQCVCILVGEKVTMDHRHLDSAAVAFLMSAPQHIFSKIVAAVFALPLWRARHHAP